MVPINREAPIGAIGVYWREGRLATDRELFLVQSLADAASTAFTNVELIHDLEVTGTRLREALDVANRASADKDTFLAVLGHELRNPLAPIVTAVALLKSRAGAPSRELATIERHGKHLMRLVDDLLDVSRVTTGKIDLERGCFDVAELVARAVEMTQPLFERRCHRLEVDVESGLEIDGDETRLSQVFANLLVNAAEHTPEGGRVSIEGRRRDQHVVIVVSDSGEGIAAEVRERLFEPFFQGRQAAGRKNGSLGLGLALARAFTELHGGTIEAASPGPHLGSTFTVTLPSAAQTSRAVAPASLSGVRAAAAPRRVLVVDDNRDAAELLAELLTDSGHDVSVAFDPDAALALAAAKRHDVAILDIDLPGMSGYELAAALRAHLGDRTPRLAALTGYGQERDRARSAAAGFAIHLVKPVDPDRVLDVVEER